MLYGVIMAVSDQRSATSSPKLVMLACDDFRQPTDLTSEGIEDVSWFITVHRYGPYVWKGRGHRGDAYISMAWLTGLTCSACSPAPQLHCKPIAILSSSIRRLCPAFVAPVRQDNYRWPVRPRV